MNRFVAIAVSTAMICGAAVAQNQASSPSSPPSPPKIEVGSTLEPSQVYDRSLSGIENEFLSLADAIPSDKWDYVPTQGDHKGVQSLGDMVKHVARANMVYYNAVLGQKPSDEDVKKLQDAKGKDAILPLLKQSFQLGHKAAASLTTQNVFQAVALSNGNGAPRAGLMTQGVAHAFDHYGHLTEYARDIGIVPPSSRR